MSSLFDKLKALVNAGVRGSRRYQREPGRPTGTAEAELPGPQVPPADESLDRATSPIAESPPRSIEQLDQNEDQTATIEEDRVADLLKRGKTQG